MTKHSAQRKGGWKATSSGGKQKKQTKLALIVLSIIIGVLLLGQAIRFIDNLFEPISKVSFTKEYSWDGKSNLNLVIKSSDIAFFSYDPFEKRVVLVSIPEETYVDVPGAFGKWQLRSVFDLGQAEDKPMGDKLLADSLSSMLGVPVDGVIALEEDKTSYEFVKSLKENPFSALSYLGKITSSLTKVEFGMMASDISKVRFDKIADLKLAEFNLLNTKTIPDGTDVLVAEPILLDNFVIDQLSESKFKEEQISVAIFNGTNIPGLAQKAARMVTNMGGNVIISTNTPNSSEPNLQVEETYITHEGLADTYTLSKLVKVFGLDCTISQKCDKIASGEITSRAAINIVLGKDFATE